MKEIKMLTMVNPGDYRNGFIYIVCEGEDKQKAINELYSMIKYMSYNGKPSGLRAGDFAEWFTVNAIELKDEEDNDFDGEVFKFNDKRFVVSFEELANVYSNRFEMRDFKGMDDWYNVWEALNK